MAEKTCAHGTPATAFCKQCDRGDPPPAQASVERMSIDRPAQELTETEHARLAQLEQTVKAGLRTFVEVGAALLEIRDQRLYRHTHSTFESYCQTTFGISRPRGYQLIQAAEVSTIVDTRNEGQARELAPLLADPEALREAHAEASTDGPPTAIKIRAAVQKRTPHAEVVPLPEQLQFEFEVDDRVLRWRAAATDAGMELREWLAALADAATS